MQDYLYVFACSQEKAYIVISVRISCLRFKRLQDVFKDDWNPKNENWGP